MLLDMRTIVLITMIYNGLFGIGMFVGKKYRGIFEGVNTIGVVLLLFSY